MVAHLANPRHQTSYRYQPAQWQGRQESADWRRPDPHLLLYKRGKQRRMVASVHLRPIPELLLPLVQAPSCSSPSQTTPGSHAPVRTGEDAASLSGFSA